eukprot:11208073-Lingulodinium_polyedra.AAC.1
MATRWRRGLVAAPHRDIAPICILLLAQGLVQELGDLALFSLLQALAQGCAETDAVAPLREGLRLV